ncbi:helix-turn-helix transcriptional regulator [Cystobacter fuscus]|uniref:winged helix-turn-helix transcriptional regulator n=1 Tax=Cystobacter fuscus TaxID=43 RepID=UPI002B2FB9C1|nr:helix-turn-helix transcriptional regulator [Cystobacter fuscus]
MRRFGEFQKSLGVAKGILTTRLRNLVALEILRLAPASDGSAYQEYLLTEKGRALFHIVVGLRQWGEQYLYAPGEAHSLLVDNESGRPVERLELRSSDGRILDWEDTSVRKRSSSSPKQRNPAATKRPRRGASES